MVVVVRVVVAAEEEEGVRTLGEVEGMAGAAEPVEVAARGEGISGSTRPLYRLGTEQSLM